MTDASFTRGMLPTAPFSESLQGRSIYLRPVVPEDYRFLYQLEVALELSGPWRNNGRTLDPEIITTDLWKGVLAQFVVVGRNTGVSHGLVKVYDPSFEHGFAYIYVAGSRKPPRPSPMIEALALLVSYVFKRWQFRKLYAVTLDGNFAPFSSNLGGLLVEEARLCNHVRIEGRYVDSVTLVLYRAAWERLGRYLAHYIRPDQDPQGEQKSPIAVSETSFDQFVGELRASGLLPNTELSTDSRLAEDLGFKEGDVMLLAGFLYEYGGVDLPIELVNELRTLGDLYHYYGVKRLW